MSGHDKALPCCCELAIGTFELLWAYIDEGDGIMNSFRLIQYSNPYAIMNIVPIYHPCPPDASHARQHTAHSPGTRMPNRLYYLTISEALGTKPSSFSEAPKSTRSKIFFG